MTLDEIKERLNAYNLAVVPLGRGLLEVREGGESRLKVYITFSKEYLEFLPNFYRELTPGVQRDIIYILTKWQGLRRGEE